MLRQRGWVAGWLAGTASAVVSLRFNGHFPRDPGLAGVYRNRMMEVVMTTEAISRGKLQSNHLHQQTNTQFFYRPDALPVAQPTVSKLVHHCT